MKHYKVTLKSKEPFGYVELGADRNGWCRSTYEQRFNSLDEASAFLRLEFTETLNALSESIRENGDDADSPDILDVIEDNDRCEIRSEYYTNYIFEIKSCR